MRVTTFSRYFPSYHPRKGEPTNFVFKIWNSVGNADELFLRRKIDYLNNCVHRLGWAVKGITGTDLQEIDDTMNSIKGHADEIKIRIQKIPK